MLLAPLKTLTNSLGKQCRFQHYFAAQKQKNSWLRMFIIKKVARDKYFTLKVSRQQEHVSCKNKNDRSNGTY